MSKALEGEHLCIKHQGNYSHYAEHNCTVCKLESALAFQAEQVRLKMEASLREQHQNQLDSPITSERELELLAVIEQKDAALTAIADPNSNHPIFFREGRVSGMSMERMYEEIAQEALALTPESALKEYAAKVLEEAANHPSFRTTIEAGRLADELRRMAEERRKP